MIRRYDGSINRLICETSINLPITMAAPPSPDCRDTPSPSTVWRVRESDKEKRTKKACDTNETEHSGKQRLQCREQSHGRSWETCAGRGVCDMHHR